MHPIHSIMGNVLGMSVSTAVVICHTSVTVSVTGSNLVQNKSARYIECLPQQGVGGLSICPWS